MTTAQDAQQVLAHLLARLQEPESKYYERYAEWIRVHEGLEAFLFKCVKPEVWTCLQRQNRNMDALKSIGGDLRFEGRAVYMRGILGLDQRIRIYVGQSTHLRSRLAQHWNFRYRRDNPSLHYHALQNSKLDYFGVLATLPSATPANRNHLFPGMDCPDLLLNILEMWMCLLFRSLPPQTLSEWLPESMQKEVIGNESRALNIANPLDCGSRAPREYLDLSESEDLLIRDYLANGDRKRSEVDYAQRVKQSQQDQKASSRNPPRWNANREKIEISVSPGVIALCAVTFLGVLWMTSGKGGGVARPRR